MTHRIAVIGGDGIGPEVTDEALKVVAAAGVEVETIHLDAGRARVRGLRPGTFRFKVFPDDLVLTPGEVRLSAERAQEPLELRWARAD